MNKKLVPFYESKFLVSIRINSRGDYQGGNQQFFSTGFGKTCEKISQCFQVSGINFDKSSLENSSNWKKDFVSESELNENSHFAKAVIFQELDEAYSIKITRTMEYFDGKEPKEIWLEYIGGDGRVQQYIFYPSIPSRFVGSVQTTIGGSPVEITICVPEDRLCLILKSLGALSED